MGLISLRSREALPKNIPALTSIRFFAAAWVVLFHFRDEFARLVPWMNHIKLFTLLGYFAVPMFFILSGFILSHTYFNKYTFSKHPEFVFLRFARLWPVHVAAILILIVYSILTSWHSGRLNDGNYPIATLPFELSMTRSWASKALIWNYPAWSIQSEWFAYIFVFPVAFACFSKASKPFLLFLATAVLLTVHSFLPIDKFPGKCMDIIFLFLAGSSLYRLRVLWSDSRGNWATVAGLCLLAIGIGSHFYLSSFFIHAAFALIIFGLTFDNGFLTSLLSKKAMVYGGNISYALYMTHAVVGKVYVTISHKLVHLSELEGFVVFLFLVAALLLMAIGFHHVIEVPCNTALRSRWSHKAGDSPATENCHGLPPPVPSPPASSEVVQ